MSEHAKYEYYEYNPSLPAAIIFIVLFAIQSIWQTYLLFKTRTWFFIPFLIGAVFEVIGYIGRAINSTETPNWTLGPYIIQTLFILLAPALLAASIYMVLARIIRLTDGEKYSLIRSTWLTKAFVAGDVLSFLMQSSGGGLLAANDAAATQKTAQDIITAGLCVQILFFGLFVLLAAIFQFRIERRPTLRAQTLSVPWRRQMYVLYGASLLIMLRNVVRVVEYVQGRQGTVLSHEVYLYVFDATLMFFVLALFSVWHPCEVISKNVRESAVRESEAKIREAGYVEQKAQGMEMA